MLRLARLCLIFASLAASPGWAMDITWVMSSPEGAATRETLDSGFLAYLTGHLPRFTHHILKVSPARAFHELQHGAGVCKPDVIVTPDREGVYAFNSRRLLMPGFRLLVRKDLMPNLAPAMTAGGEVDLAKFAAVKGVRGGFTGQRHYDPVIADFIQQRGNDGMDSVVATFQLFNLIQAGRIDFTFVLPVDFFFYDNASQRDSMALLHIKDAAPAIDAGIACSSEPSGRAVIAAVDSLFSDDSQWAAFVEPMRKWMPPDDFARLLAGRQSALP